jgi:retron-type reverse transcriptase
MAWFFDDMSHEWTVKFIEHRVADRRILRLIRKWLKAGVSEDGQWKVRHWEQSYHRCWPTCKRRFAQ